MVVTLPGCHSGHNKKLNERISPTGVERPSAISPSLLHLSPLQNAMTKPRALIVFRQLKYFFVHLWQIWLFAKTCLGQGVSDRQGLVVTCI
ncbi:hypothetical protein NQ317_005299 [Molorchus minor]|uniref:Uncharacterized protein n=1 Tax=Molorchus minor TaxID=1323400 RepID=A0ABQ9JPK9_9CUCU|nr:hypothetical protein NQ317_005299 [Molorchus minor]